MKIKLTRPCIVGGKSRKPTGKPIEVSAREGKVLIATGKAVSAEPVEEPLAVNVQVDPAELAQVKEQIADLTARLEEADKALKEKDEQIADMTARLEEASKTKGKAAK